MLETAIEPFAIESLRDRVTPAEWAARIDLAACYRLVAHYGMADMAANHVSLAVPGEEGAFLINAYGMLYEEKPNPALEPDEIVVCGEGIRYRPSASFICSIRSATGLMGAVVAVRALPQSSCRPPAKVR